MDTSEENHVTVQSLVDKLRTAGSKETKKEILTWLVRHEPAEFSPENLQIITSFLHDPAPSVRSRTAAVLGHCKSSAFVRPLTELLEDPDDNVVCSAAVALGEIADPSAAPALEAALDRFQDGVAAAEAKKARQRLIEPRIYPNDPVRTVLTFHWRDRLGHDKAESRAERRIADTTSKLQAVQAALAKCKGKL